MLILVLLWGLLPGKGVWCLTGPSMVTVRSRSAPRTVQCFYDEGYENYIKYWCKGPTFKYCTVQITSREHNKEISNGRFTIKDSTASRTLSVTMTDMRPGDAGTYYCGIERRLGDNMHQVEVVVLPGVCYVAAPWKDTVDFPSNFTEIEDDDVVKVACREGYEKKNITLKCREESGGFFLSAQSDGDYCVGVCRKASPWTDIVDFPENFTEIAVNGSVVVSFQQRYEEKLRLQCREESGEFLLSPEDGQGSCVGVCSKASPWTDIVDFPENFTEIAVNGSVVVSCQQRHEEKKLRLQCREESGEFLLSPEDGQGSCVDNKRSAMVKQMRFLLTSTFGFVVPFLVKLVVLLMMLVVKTSFMVNQRLYRKGPDLSTSLEERNVYVQPKPCMKKEQDDISLQQMEVQEDEIYESLDME